MNGSPKNIFPISPAKSQVLLNAAPIVPRCDLPYPLFITEGFWKCEGIEKKPQRLGLFLDFTSRLWQIVQQKQFGISLAESCHGLLEQDRRIPFAVHLRPSKKYGMVIFIGEVEYPFEPAELREAYGD